MECALVVVTTKLMPEHSFLSAKKHSRLNFHAVPTWHINIHVIIVWLAAFKNKKASTADKFRQEKLCNLMSKCHNNNIVLQLAVPRGLVNLSHVFIRCPCIKRNFLWQHVLGPKFHFILKSVSKICWFNLAYSTRLIWTILTVAFCEWKWPYEIKLRPY